VLTGICEEETENLKKVNKKANKEDKKKKEKKTSISETYTKNIVYTEVLTR
jgi:hypothetical protein